MFNYSSFYMLSYDLQRFEVVPDNNAAMEHTVVPAFEALVRKDIKGVSIVAQCCYHSSLLSRYPLFLKSEEFSLIMSLYLFLIMDGREKCNCDSNSNLMYGLQLMESYLTS
ncbi:hypothetical protein MKX01_031640 [Papaver californicum]|nr:hypothetical protein MKX01_031640 [Papaver californicum]